VLPLAPRFDTVGWFARDATLLERVGSVLLPTAASDGGTPSALVLWSELWQCLDASARAPFLDAALALARALRLPLRQAPAPSPARWLEAYLTLQNLEATAHHRDFIERHRESFGSLIGRRLDAVLATPAARAESAEATRAELVTSLATAFAGGAWLVLPSAPGAAPLRGLSDDAVDAFTGRGLTLAAVASLCGTPQLSLPLAYSEGCPLGVSLLAPPGADRALLATARAVAERLAPATQEIA
jgi:amidase